MSACVCHCSALYAVVLFFRVFVCLLVRSFILLSVVRSLVGGDGNSGTAAAEQRGQQWADKQRQGE